MARFWSEIAQRLKEEFAFGVKDVRQKAVEQAWFGQVTTPQRAEVGDWFGTQQESGISAPAIGEPEIGAPKREPMTPDELKATIHTFSFQQRAGTENAQAELMDHFRWQHQPSMRDGAEVKFGEAKIEVGPNYGTAYDHWKNGVEMKKREDGPAHDYERSIDR